MNNKVEPDFKSKANFFNKFFADKCFPVENNNVIPNFIECESMKTDLPQSSLMMKVY